jgi:uncharacterized YigZ family protein
VVSRYPVPAGPHRVEDEIRRSRFVTTMARTATVEDAQIFIQRIRDEFPDATHHCWAYVVGPPGSTAQVGMSDDGEPHGTAGRPMMTALLHSGVGDIAVVVTRYYGGTNLGTGGLVRAYGGGVAHALETLPRLERVDYVAMSVSVDYGRVSALEQALPSFEAQVDGRRFDTDVTFDLRLPDTRVDAFRQAILDLTRGQARFS